MAWFCNYYKCARCGFEWKDQWSCMCDDDCCRCGARHMSPYRSDDLTEIIHEQEGTFAILRSADTAEHVPGYEEIARFSTIDQAKTYLASSDR
jgi:hypothetical protein